MEEENISPGRHQANGITPEAEDLFALAWCISNGEIHPMEPNYGACSKTQRREKVSKVSALSRQAVLEGHK